MRASRAPVYAKLIGYLLGAQTIQDAAQNLPLAIGQELQRPQWVIGLGARSNSLPQQDRIHRNVPLMCHLQGLDDGPDGLLLSDETLGSLGQSICHQAPAGRA